MNTVSLNKTIKVSINVFLFFFKSHSSPVFFLDFKNSFLFDVVENVYFKFSSSKILVDTIRTLP